jgi:hypothetical protein
VLSSSAAGSRPCSPCSQQDSPPGSGEEAVSAGTLTDRHHCGLEILCVPTVLSTVLTSKDEYSALKTSTPTRSDRICPLNKNSSTAQAEIAALRQVGDAYDMNYIRSAV